MADRIQMDDQAKRSLMSIGTIPSVVDIGGRKYHPKEYAGAGFKGVVWKGKDYWGNPVAIKFAVSEDYEERSFLQEAFFANKLRGYPRFAYFIDAGLVKIDLKDGPKTFVCFVEEWVDGLTLEEYLENPGAIPPVFIVNYIKMMCEALSNLSYSNLCHDDLRPSNVKIAPPKPGSLTTDETEVKIVDTGSLKPAPSKKEKDDHRWFVQHIIDIRNAIYRKKRLSPTERHFIHEIIPLLDKMLDEDKSVALTDPSKIAEQFESTWNECRLPIEEREQKLRDPFHYISAETISSDKLLVDLFAESCPWKSDALSPDPLVLTGPRGCGKSTIFRRFSLKGMLCKGPEEIRNAEIAGFYISCSADLRNHVNWISNDNLLRRFRGEISHYFNLLLTKEIVSTFNIIAMREDRESLFGFSTAEEKGLHKFIVERLVVPESDRLRLQGVPPMAHAYELIENEMEKCHSSMVRGLSYQKTQSSYISSLSDFLNENISYMRQRKIVFFIDDLSTRQIPKQVQSVFNDVILQRAKNHVFKISSDKYGWFGLDSLASGGEKTREFRELDCGKFFLVDVDSASKRSFAEELLAKRLNLANYQGKPNEIIGQSKYPEGSLGSAIRNRARNKKKPNAVYYGLETITDLCCGDISVLLEIYRRIFKRGGVTRESHSFVLPHIQQSAIESVSRELYSHIKSYRPCGDEMYGLVTQFGTLSRRILLEGKPHRQQDRFVYPQTARIEVDEDPNQPSISLTERQREIMEELIKRAIFIELEPGRARRGFKPSLRWQLRPVLCPAFLTVSTKNVPIKWTPEQFKFFLNDPERMCQNEFEEEWRPETGRQDTGATLANFTNMKKEGGE